MSQPRPSALGLARAIVAAELAQEAGRLDRVMTKAEAKLGRLIGPAGFDVLLARSLTLATRERPALASVSASTGGRLLGLPADTHEMEESTVVLVSHLCELLMKFIGEDLATRIFRDVWPPATDDGASKESNG